MSGVVSVVVKVDAKSETVGAVRSIMNETFTVLFMVFEVSLAKTVIRW